MFAINNSTRRFVLTAGIAAVLAVAPAQFAHAQAGKKPAAKKPAAGKPAAGAAKADPKRPIVLGTTQLPGDFGKLGQTYTIGKYEPINVTLDSARYAADRFVVGNNIWAPKNDEKLLILRYTVHNPLPKEQSFYWASLKFTAVDAQDTNREYIQATRRAGAPDMAAFSVSLKPAQKVQLETAILVPANGVVPKLIVQREQDGPVIRYDLHGKVTPLPTPFADPADSEGATLLADVPVKPGEFYAAGPMDVKVDAIGEAVEKTGGITPLEGKEKLQTVTVTMKNTSPSRQPYYWAHWNASVKDADGEKTAAQQTLAKATRPDVASDYIEPGEEIRVRFLFKVPANAPAPKTFSLREAHLSGIKGRTLTFDLSGLGSSATASAQ